MKKIISLMLIFAVALGSVAALAADEYPLNPADYAVTVTSTALGVPESAAVEDRFFNDAVFIGDSITLKLKLYATEQRNAGSSCLGRAQFLTAGSLGSGNALEAVSSDSLHPTYQGEKMTLEKAVELMGAMKVYIMLGMNDVAVYGAQGAVDNMVTLINKILERTPEAEIFVESATPRISTMTTKPTNRQLFDYDLLLYNACVEHGWHYVDVAYVMRDANGYLPVKYCSDPEGMGMHFTDEGCQAWIEYLKTHTKE